MENNFVLPFYLDLSSEEIKEIQSVTGDILHSGNLILDKYTNEFETLFAEYVGTKYAVSLSTCTAALQVLFQIKNLKGKLVGVQTNTNFATVAALIHTGAIPVFMDMDPLYFSPSLEILKTTLAKNPNISAFVWVHIGGIIHPDFEKITEYCKINNLTLIEDCAHAHGSFLNNKSAGSFADGGAFSFFPTKVMTTIEGGMIVTNNKNDALLAKSYRNQGKRAGNYGGLHTDLGSSLRISEISAYIGIVQLRKLNKMVSTRSYYAEKLSNMLLKNNIDFCSTSHMDQASNYKFIIKHSTDITTEEIKDKFKKENVILGGGVYEVPCHLQPVFNQIKVDRNSLSMSEKYCPTHICPPITSGTTDSDFKKISASIETILL